MFSRLFRGRSVKSQATPTPRTGDVSEWLDLPASLPLSISTVYRCVDLLSSSVANLPLRYRRLRSGVFVDDLDSRLHYLLNVEPDVATNAFDFWKQLVIEILMSGNAYIVPFYSPVGGDYVRLGLCSRGSVWHDTMTDTYTVNDQLNGIHGTYGEADIIHVKGMTGADPKRGMSVLGYARRTMSIANVGDRETYNRFENGGDVRGILGNDKTIFGVGDYQDAQISKAARIMDRRFRSGERIVSVPGTLEWQQLTMSSADLQFLESRKFTVRELCRFFGVHPSFVFDDTSNNYKSAEMANVAFLSNTLNPLLRRIELELLRKLFPESLSRKRQIKFDRKELYACDLLSKVSYQTKMVQGGFRTINECRKEDDMPPVDGGDKLLVSANLKGIDELEAQPSEPKEPTKGNEDGED